MTPTSEVATRIAKCPACGAEGQHTVIESDKTYEMRLCCECSLVFEWPMIHPGVGWYATASNYTSSTLGNKALDALANPERMVRGAHRYFLRDLPGRGGRLLDVGCGPGVFLSAAKKGNYQVTGFDIQERVIHTARSRYRLSDVHVASVGQFFRHWQVSRLEHYHVITMFDVLEHLQDPASSIAMLCEMLLPGGWLVITLPNRTRRPDFYRKDDRPPNHLTRWERVSLSKFLSMNGFEVTTLREFNEKGLVTLRVYGSVLSAFRCVLRKSLLRKSGLSSTIGESMCYTKLHKAAGWAWYCGIQTAMVLDAPVYGLLRLIRAPGQMLYCVARKVGVGEKPCSDVFTGG